MKQYTVGVAGYAGAGKDTVVDAMVRTHGFSRVAFADPLRDFAWAVNPIVSYVETRQLVQDGDGEWTDVVYLPFRYQDALNEVGYTEAKIAYPEVRNLLQKIGTEGARETFWDSFWVDIAKKRSEEAGGRVAYSDLRFPNEAAVCDFTVWVSRAGVNPVNAHPSDNALNDWDFDLVLTNDTSFDDLYQQVAEMVAAFDAR